ncbi:hypothetical protein [Streptomyces bauhiniae]|uniref:hypothetical protein n=1 Tax=Streptomyces bauhiniae TaxID=2340725 RepID=UPI0035E381B1
MRCLSGAPVARAHARRFSPYATPRASLGGAMANSVSFLIDSSGRELVAEPRRAA